MPAPSEATYSVAALVAAHTSLRDLIDAENGSALVRIYDAADTLLSRVWMTDPCGTVNGTTGQLTLTFTGATPEALESGTAAYGSVCDATGVSVLDLPVTVGTGPVSGFLVLNSLAIGQGLPVTINSATIG